MPGDRIIVGRVGRPHGVRGEVTVVPDTDNPDVFAPGATMATGNGRDLVVATVSRFRDRGLIVRFEGVSGRDGAEDLRGETLSVPRNRSLLDDGEFWPDELIGLKAVGVDGEELGVVSAVQPGTAQDRLVVTTADGSEVLVPFVDELVGDPDGDRIEVRDPGGLF
jgi:16S rRNA processing protein RimM